MANKNSNLSSLKQSEQAKKTNLAEWWSNQFHELDLPSGLHVMVRDADLEDLITTGSLPNTLMSVFPELEGMSDKDATKKMMDEHPELFAVLLDGISKACLVQPRIGDVRDIENGIILISDLRGKDKMALFSWVNREAEQMRSFREGESEPIAIT